MGATVQSGQLTVLGVAIPVLLFWIGERNFDGSIAIVLWTLFATFMLAFLPFGDQFRRWAIAYTITFFWRKLRGDEMTRINGVAGLEMLTIAALAVSVCLLLSVIPFPRTARSAARDQLTDLSDSFVELLEPLSDAFCEPLKNGHFRKKVTSRTQNTFERLRHIEKHLADAWYEPACFDPLRRGRLIVFAEHMRMCLRCLHILVNLRNQRAPHKATTRFHNEWQGVEQAVNDVIRLLGDYACGRAVDDAALDVSIGNLRGAMTAWHMDRSYGVIDTDGATPPVSREQSTNGFGEVILEGSQAPRVGAGEEQRVKDTFSFQMDYLYHLMERYIHDIGRPVPFVSSVIPGHSIVTSHAVLEEVRASQPREAGRTTEGTPMDANEKDSVFKKYGFWASFPRTMPSVKLTKERLRYTAKTVFPVCSYGIFCICFLVGDKYFGSAFSKSLNRFLGTVLACLAGYFPLYLFGPTPLVVLLVNSVVLFGFVFMRSSSSPGESYIGATAAWILPLVTMGVTDTGRMELVLWRMIMEKFVAILVVLLYDYLIFGQRAETLLRQKLARSLQISSRVISKVVKHYTVPCGHCQARASLECENRFLELLELGYEQRQLVNFAAMEPSLWHPPFAKDGFMILCKTTEKIRLHAISLRRSLELASWTSALSDCGDHTTTPATNTAEVPTPFLYSVVMELGEPLVQSVGYLDVSFGSLARAVMAPRLELPDDMTEVNENLPDLFDSYSNILARVDRKRPGNQIISSQSVMHTIVSLADATAVLWQALCSVADDEKRVAAIAAQQQEIRKALERHQREIHVANIKRQREVQAAANSSRKKWPALSLPKRSSSLQRGKSPDAKARPWQSWRAQRKSPKIQSAGASPTSGHGSMKATSQGSVVEEAITKLWSNDKIADLRPDLPERARTLGPIPTTDGVRKDDNPKQRSLLDIVSATASLIEKSQKGDVNATI